MDFEQLGDMGSMISARNSHEQNRLLAEQNRLLSNQERERNRIAALPKCPECKKPLDEKPNICPHCRHRLTWLALSDATYTISENSLGPNLLLMSKMKDKDAKVVWEIAKKKLANLGKSFERMPQQIRQLSTLRVSNPELYKDRFISALIKNEIPPSVFGKASQSFFVMLLVLFFFGSSVFIFSLNFFPDIGYIGDYDSEAGMRAFLNIVGVIASVVGIWLLCFSGSILMETAGILRQKMLLNRATQLGFRVLMSSVNSIQAGVAEINKSLGDLRLLANDMREIRSIANANNIRLDNPSKQELYQPHTYQIKRVNLTRDSSDWAINILANELQASHHDLVFFLGYLGGSQRNFIPNRQVDIEKTPEYWIKRNNQTIGPFSRGKLAKVLRAKTEIATKFKFPCVKCKAMLMVSSERLGSTISCYKCKQRQKLPASIPSNSGPDLISKSRNGPWSKLTQELIEKLT